MGFLERRDPPIGIFAKDGERRVVYPTTLVRALDWQPIETAPKDRQVLMLSKKWPKRPLVAHWMEGGYCIEDHPAISAGWYFWTGAIYDLVPVPELWMDLPAKP